MNSHHTPIDLDQQDWFLHAYLAKNMDARLDILKQQPQTIFLSGTDGNTSHPHLKRRYPQAHFNEFDSRLPYLQDSAKRRKKSTSIWKIKPRNTLIQTASDLLPPEQQADMVWANLSLMHQHKLEPLITNWAQSLKPNGMLFFTHLGPDTLKEIVQLWRAHHLDVKIPPLIDMHDLGDLLLHHGFYDPVMDMTPLSLQYQTSQKWLQDMQLIGLWEHIHINDKDQALDILSQAMSSNQLNHLTMELVYGHAIKKDTQTSATITESVIHLHKKQNNT